jgi:hypothetical protein
MKKRSTEYPLKGQKVRYSFPTEWAFFTHVIDDERKFLELGKEYVVKEVFINSSTVYIELEGFPYYDEERQLPFFNAWAFDW